MYKRIPKKVTSAGALVLSNSSRFNTGVTADLVPRGFGPPRAKSASGIGPGGPYPRGTKSAGTPEQKHATYAKDLNIINQ